VRRTPAAMLTLPNCPHSPFGSRRWVSLGHALLWSGCARNEHTHKLGAKSQQRVDEPAKSLKLHAALTGSARQPIQAHTSSRPPSNSSHPAGSPWLRCLGRHSQCQGSFLQLLPQCGDQCGCARPSGRLWRRAISIRCHSEWYWLPTLAPAVPPYYKGKFAWRDSSQRRVTPTHTLSNRQACLLHLPGVPGLS